ncbi:MAG: glycosyltransferase family 4 protein [Thermoleophilia bacterium]|nr:glycosyltransferase family 4 protein [Thermoleophilia bacterium]
MLWVVPRYGREVLGGAEALVRALAEHASPPDWSVAVATSCAVDHTTWRNELKPGRVEVEGVAVHRFPVGTRDGERYDALHPPLLRGELDYAGELEWLANSVTSPAMEAFLEREAERFDLIVAAPYLFGTTVWGAQVAPDRTALMPCLHDEPYARLRTVAAVIEACRGCMFNADEEERFARERYRVSEGGVVGMGFDDPGPAPPPPRSAPAGPYLVYAGRLEEGKGVHELVEHVTAMRRADPAAPRLLLLGRGGYRIPERSRPHVVSGGFVSDSDKRALLAGSLALVSASRMESMSIVQMEAWIEGVPSIVSAGSAVMADHVARSGGGHVFADGAEFADAVRALVADPAEARRMGARGREWTLDVYGWPAVRARFRDVVERLAA